MPITGDLTKNARIMSILFVFSQSMLLEVYIIVILSNNVLQVLLTSVLVIKAGINNQAIFPTPTYDKNEKAWRN